MQVIKERLKAAQVKHDARVAEIEKEHEEKLKSLQELKDSRIEDSATELVEGIIGKL